MARANVVHSEDAVTVLFAGNRNKPEPSTGIIRFPGGHVEVARTSDGAYWAHVEVEKAGNIQQSRIDYNHEGYEATGGSIPTIPHADKIQHMAILVGREEPNEKS